MYVGGKRENKEKRTTAYYIKIHSCDFNHKIPAIKALRNVTGWGLKKSKEIIDGVVCGNTQKIKTKDDISLAEIKAYMFDGRVMFTVCGGKIEPLLKPAIQLALDLERYDVVHLLVQAIEKNGAYQEL